MASRARSHDESPAPRRKPGTTPDARERQLINAAYDLAEKQLLEGTASAQVTTHFLRLGSSREMIEQERIRNENALLIAKRENMASAARVEELYGAAIAAMRSYAGGGGPDLSFGGGDAEDVDDSYGD